LGQRKLLAAESADETAAAHFSAIFETPKHSQQQAPTRNISLGRHQIAEHDSVSGQQHARRGFNSLILKARLFKSVCRIRKVPGEQRPAPGGTPLFSVG